MLRFGPKSLAGQLMLATALTLLIAQAINLALLLGSQRDERHTMIASSAATLIAEVDDRITSGQQLPQRFFLNPPAAEAPAQAETAAAAASSATPDAERPRARGENARRDGARGNGERRDGERGRGGGRDGRRIIIADAPNFREGMTDWPEMAERVRDILRQDGFTGAVRVGHMVVPANTANSGASAGENDRARRIGQRGDMNDMTQRDPSEVVAVAAQIADGRWLTVRARVPVQEGRLGMMLVGQTVVLLGLLLIPLLFMAWRVSRPLSRLAQAARSVRPASEQPPLPETGPSDVRELTRAFNTMRERIVAMLSEKDRMLGAIGHDLRTPLASLRLRVEQVDNDRLRDAMIASIENMAAMLEDILALARTGQPRETPENTDVVALVRELVDEYTALDRPVLLMVEDGLRDHRDIRPIGLQRALRNLIDNAVSYAGAARVAVGKDRDGLKIRVEDDGPGIPEDQIETIMEPFTRLEESRNRNTGGSGLGLALARAAVQAEGGQIILTNRVPRGLTAMIQLPSHA